MKSHGPFKAVNYCVSFIDLLGQRSEFANEGLLPKFESDEDKKKFTDKFRNTIGHIDALHRDSDRFLSAMRSYISPARENLPPNTKLTYDEMKEFHLKEQRWSDGLIYFVSLEKGDVKCPMYGIYTLLGLSGGLCFQWLARKAPLRGSIDIAWATELKKGELFGPGVAKAYELESQVAQYPRIIAGPRVVDFLIANIRNPATDIYGKFNQKLGKICYNMLAQDFDGYHFVHYLGDVFHEMVTKDIHQELYQLSKSFIVEQCKKWRNERNTKL